MKLLKYKKKQIIILAFIVLILISFVVVFGRYVTNTINDFFVRSKEFYFFSDKMSEDGSVFQVDNWSGVDDYSFTINMNSNNNNIEAATYDIGYTVSYTCSDNAICQLSKEEGTILSSTNSDYFIMTITPNKQLDTGDKVVVEVEATSTSPYKKTIKGQFTLVVGKENLSYQITDTASNPYMILSLTNTLTYYVINEAFDSYNAGDKIDIDTYLALTDEQKNKCYSALVEISFNPEDILLDVTSSVYSEATDITTTTINGKTYINGFKIAVEAISSKEIRFYKQDVSKNYTYPNTSGTASIVTVTSE